MTFDRWLEIGQSLGYCTRTLCAVHDGVLTDAEWESFYALADAEQEEYLSDGEPCAFVVRLLNDQPDEAL